MTSGADRLRPPWSSLPSALRSRVVGAIGGRFVTDTPAHGGFSAGYAGTVHTTSGRAFVKAMPAAAHADSLALYRREAAVLIHGDLRADNILLADDRARFIDWPYAVRGAAWFDLPSLLPSVEAGGGPSCEVAWTVFEEFGAPQPDEHLPLIAGIASYFWFAQAQPEPLGVPGLRAFQRAQAVPALRWLSSLL
ncbi:phosphotransferase [Microbacterium sp. Mu-80]|uniref:Phosphotransferase n=1 Tax=Microbacterium bandirmense TaxID=3122050 RepID=A0ABU8L9S8_9MICO